MDKNNKTDNIEEHFVDLGLPSGIKWAKTNLGAENETDYGNYYMWGSTIPSTKTECNWTNAPFNNGSGSYDSTYFNSVKDTVCPNGVLAKEFDAAYQSTNGMAHIPTKDEIQELLDNTDHEWIEDFNGTGVNGMKFISKTDESKYIFIPAAGSCYGGSVFSVGYDGYVWSSSLNASNPDYAWYLYFYSGSCYMGSSGRYGGRSIRPVTD